MGYYTRFELTIESDKEFDSCKHKNPADAVFCMKCGKKIDKVSIEDAFRNFCIEKFEDKTFTYPIAETLDGTAEEWKWYDHEKDMRIVSQKFPEALFILSGEGEESGDIWKEYYKNGKMQRSKAIVTFEEFDPKKLS